MTSKKQRHVVAKEDEFKVGARTILKVGGREIGVFHTTAGLFALRNSCPHQAAPLCLGPVTGTTMPSMPGEYIWGMDGQVLRCPWHGWEFDLKSGVGLYDPYKHERVATYEVKVEQGEVVLYA
ncbi:MAG TPA: Rieske (2Fe-2S) protein [Chloroflexota bacterium]|nr:Rieske (2Fe-2S) protein [Chloroflexota bacterium]